METILEGTQTLVCIAPDRPTVLIGERINPTGRKRLAAELVAGNIAIVKEEALAQVESGADIIDVNVGAAGVDQATVLPRAVEMVQEVVGVPISIDTADPVALEAALKVCQGKALVNSINGDDEILNRVLPLVARYKAAVIGLCMDEEGIPSESQKRMDIAKNILKQAQDMGIPQEDVLIDCLAMAVSADQKAALATLETIRKVRTELGVNMTLGASNVSFGMPDRDVINTAFLAIAIREGVNAPIVNPAHVRQAILAVDVLLGRDEYAQKYIKYYRGKPT